MGRWECYKENWEDQRLSSTIVEYRGYRFKQAHENIEHRLESRRMKQEPPEARYVYYDGSRLTEKELMAAVDAWLDGRTVWPTILRK
jgi:hypothetical protein